MKIKFPEYAFNVRESETGTVIFDRLRKKYVALTPEEAVRQNCVEYRKAEKGYPAGLMGNEVAIVQNGIKRRCDTVVFDRKGDPLMIVEYKSQKVRITQEVFNQIYRYNLVLKVEWMVVTNGDDVYCCRVDYAGRKTVFVDGVPEYSAITVPAGQ